MTAIQARIVDDGTNDEVVPWTIIDASPSGNVFAGTITVPSGGWYNIQVRFANDVNINDGGTVRWGIGILVGTAGQSNMTAWFFGGPPPLPVSTTAMQYKDGVWNRLFDGSGGGIGAFCTSLQDSMVTSIPVAMLNYGVGASNIASWSGPGNVNYDQFIVGVDGVTDSLEYILWSQGESEQVRGDSAAFYADSLATGVIANLRNDLVNASTAANIPFIIALVGRNFEGPPTQAEVEDIRIAQREVADTVPDTYIGGTKTDVGLKDAQHLDDAGTVTIGLRMAQCAAFTLGEVATYRGPHITGYQTNSTTETVVTIVHEGGSDFTPTSGITGFEVLDGGVDRSISAAIRVNATTIRLTHAAVTGAKVVRYLYGNPDIANPVFDNTALALPLEGSPSIP